MKGGMKREIGGEGDLVPLLFHWRDKNTWGGAENSGSLSYLFSPFPCLSLSGCWNATGDLDSCRDRIAAIGP